MVETTVLMVMMVGWRYTHKHEQLHLLRKTLYVKNAQLRIYSIRTSTPVNIVPSSISGELDPFRAIVEGAFGGESKSRMLF